MSTKFKVGDKVRRMVCDWCDYREGQVYTVSRVSSVSVWTEECPQSNGADQGRFELVIEDNVTKQEEKVMKVKKNEWKFSVSSDKLIDLHEISKSLTRETPCAIVHRGDGYSTVVLHDNLYTKHIFMKKDVRVAFEEEVGKLHSIVWQETNSGYLTPLMAAIKAVQTQPVRNKFRNKCDVTVQQVSL